MTRITSSVSLNMPRAPQEPDGFFDQAPAGPTHGSGHGAFADPLAQAFPGTRLPHDQDPAGASARHAPMAAAAAGQDGLGSTLSRLGFTTENGRPRFSPGTSAGPCRFKLRLQGMTLQHPLPDEIKLETKCRF